MKPVLLFALVFVAGMAQAQTREVCDFKLQACISQGELVMTTWGNSTPPTCYTRDGDNLIPDPCSGQPNHRHVEPLPESGLPVAPSASKCWQSLFDETGKKIIYTEVSCDSIPTAQWHEIPMQRTVGAKTWEDLTGKSAGFWTFRGKWQDPALRTNRQFFHSRLIWIADSIAMTSAIVACSRKNSQEGWASEMPAMGAVLGLGYIGDRFFTRSFGLGPMVYATAHYIHAATR